MLVVVEAARYPIRGVEDAWILCGRRPVFLTESGIPVQCDMMIYCSLDGASGKGTEAGSTVNVGYVACTLPKGVLEGGGFLFLMLGVQK